MDKKFVRRPISRDLAEQIVDSADILMVIAERQVLRSIGKNYLGKCPFCGRREFAVSEEKNFYHCFACEKSGSSLTYLIEVAGMTFYEGVEHLGRMQGINFDDDGLQYEN